MLNTITRLCKMASESTLNLLHPNNYHFPTHFHQNESEILLVSDAIYAEELQLLEALNASLISCQMMSHCESSPSPSMTPVPSPQPSMTLKETGESSLSFCQNCMERKENEEIFRNEGCDHSFCSDCISKHVVGKLQDAIKPIPCQGLNCKSVLELNACRSVLSQQAIHLWEDRLSKEPIVDCSATMVIKNELEKEKGDLMATGLEEEDKQTRDLRSSREKALAAINRRDTLIAPHSINLSPEKNTAAAISGQNYGHRAGRRAFKLLEPSSFYSKKWEHADTVQRLLKRGNGGSEGTCKDSWLTHVVNSRVKVDSGDAKPQESDRDFEKIYPQPVIEDGTSSKPGIGSSQPCGSEDSRQNVEDDVDYSDDDLSRDDSDAESCEETLDLETYKRSKWFKKFLEGLDGMTMEEINEPARQWHCPACQGGPGAIKRFRGLPPLITHAKTTGTQRVKLHRVLAELLEKKIQKRSTSVNPNRQVSVTWKGLKDEQRDHLIVWPPIVVIRNTNFKPDGSDKWIGIGNQELLDYFSSYDAAVKAQNSYDPRGNHRGMSLLIFESSARGYLEAERLHKQFQEQGTDRYAWDNRPVLLLPSGKHQLYGYMASKEDLDFFNRHSQGKNKLKYEMRSYQAMVVNRIRQMDEDNHQLLWLKNRAAEDEKRVKVLDEANGVMNEKLRKTKEENQILKEKARLHHEQSKEEMEYLEQFYKDKITAILEARDAKEDDPEEPRGDLPENTEEPRYDLPENTDEPRFDLPDSTEEPRYDPPENTEDPPYDLLENMNQCQTDAEEYGIHESEGWALKNRRFRNPQGTKLRRHRPRFRQADGISKADLA